MPFTSHDLPCTSHDLPCTPVERVRLASLALARETRALLVQSTLMHRDLTPTLPSNTAPNDTVVVVLHGLFATAGALRPLRNRIEQTTHFKTASFSYEPGCNLTTVVERLRNLLRRLPPSCSIHLVGHSMGGLAARYYVQVGEGDERVRQTISLASPFHGSNIARFAPRRFCPDLEPDSPALRELLRQHPQADHVPHTSIASTHDQLVWPWQNAIYPHGTPIVVHARGHNTLLFDRCIASHVTRALQSLRLTRPSTSTPPRLSRSLPLAS